MSAIGPKRTFSSCRLPRLRSAAAQTFSIRPAQSFFPEFDYFGRKFAPSDPGASAGFRPHLKQGVIFTEQVALRDLVSFRTRPFSTAR